MNLSASHAKRWLNAALSFCYPESCQLCGDARATPDECFVCADCRCLFRWVEPPFCQHCGMPSHGAITTTFECANCLELSLSFSSARAAVVANETSLDVIHRFKYTRARWFEPLLAGLLIEKARPALAALIAETLPEAGTPSAASTSVAGFQQATMCVAPGPEG